MNRHLPVRLVLAGIPLFALSLFVACGDDIENTTINQTGVELFDSSEDLPECTDKNESDLVFVRGETSARICVDGEWIAMASDGSDVDFSCKTVELKDKSGLKIVCNGDSIGVVLNGSDGKDGKAGEDGKDATLPQDTLEADSERVAISLDSLVGITQKGPFLKGSTVYLYELSDGRTLKQTNGNFTSNITSNDGRYKFTARDLVSQYAMVVVDGYYRNEVTGNTSDAPIRLKAITDMRKRSSVNVNILTQLEFDRVYNLVTRGDRDGKKLTVKQAKRQAQKEILKLFDIELGKDTDAEDMDVFGKTDADAALLAVSVLLQGDGGSTDLLVLLTEISNAIAEKGEWNDSAAKARIADWALKADTENRLAKFRKNVADWHLGDTVPGFEKFVRNYVNVVTGLGECGGEKTPIGNFAHIPNVNSAYFAQAYDSIDVTKNSLVRFVCDEEGGNHWRLATALERDTRGWEAAEDGAVQMGQIDTSIVYVYDGGWRQGTELDRVVGFGCIEAFRDSVAEVSDSSWYACTVSKDEGHAWHLMSNLEKDSVSLKAYNDSLPGLLLDAPFTKKTMVWDADTLREASKYEQQLKKGCVTRMYGTKDSLSNTLTYTCDKSGWSKIATFVDRRGNSPTYKAVHIGEQIWMAENLNYRYSGKTTTLDSSSFCYGNDPANCEKYGRLYLWSTAMDSADRARIACFGEICLTLHDEVSPGKDCGYKVKCKPKPPILGVCPEGWHLPDTLEWKQLIDSVGGETIAGLFLKSQTGWLGNGNGLDSYGFSALPAGYRLNNELYRQEKQYAYFWSSTEYDHYDSYYIRLEYGDIGTGNPLPDYAVLDYQGKNNAMSVRCVKD